MPDKPKAPAPAPLTLAEYEEKYAEAIEQIRFTIIGPEEHRLIGRIRMIDNYPCNDYAVFAKAWGREAADDFIRRSGSR